MKIHLGCGKRDFDGWVNVDLADFPHIHHRTSVDDLSIFDDGIADVIYSSHTLEYFDRQEAIVVLKECKRVLKPNGILRVAVPDIDALIQVYQNSKNLKNILGPIYGRMELNLNDKIEYIYHKTCYNYLDLKQILLECGFFSVKRYNWKETDHAQFDDHSQAYFPHMDKENGINVSLNVEAYKK